MYVFIDAKMYNLDVFQHLKRTNMYVSFISLSYWYQCIFIILSISDLDF